MLEQRAEPRQGGLARIGVDSRRRKIAADHEVRPLAAPDLLGDHPADDVGVRLVVDVEPGSLQGDRGGGAGMPGPRRGGSGIRSSITRQRSGAPSSWQTNPRSRTCRKGTSASTSRGTPSASTSGMSARSSTSTTGAGEQLDGRVVRAMSANGPLPVRRSWIKEEGSGPVIEVLPSVIEGPERPPETRRTAPIPREGGLSHACSPPRRWATSRYTRAWRRIYHRAALSPRRVRRRRLRVCLQ